MFWTIAVAPEPEIRHSVAQNVNSRYLKVSARNATQGGAVLKSRAPQE
jgi:hypothetical protein